MQVIDERSNLDMKNNKSVGYAFTVMTLKPEEQENEDDYETGFIE